MAKKNCRRSLNVKLSIRKRKVVEFELLESSKFGKWRKGVIILILFKLFEKIVELIFNQNFN